MSATHTVPLETQAMPFRLLPSREWIWVPRILLTLVFVANGGMRLTLSHQELLLLGDWTLPILPSGLTGLGLVLSGFTLLLPRRRPWGVLTLAGSFLLLTYLLGSLLTHLTAASGHGWTIDLLRLAGLSIVLQDLWRSHFLAAARA